MVHKLIILKLEPDLDPKPEKLCEHGAWCLKKGYNEQTYIFQLDLICLEP